MAETPATPTETPTPAPAAAAPAAAPAPPAPAPAATPAPATETAEQAPLTNSSPVDYVTDDGAHHSTTMGELLEAQAKLAEIGDLGDLQKIRDLQGAMNDDPEAKRRVLQAALDEVTPTPDAAASDSATTAILDRVSQLEQAAQRSNRVVQAAEDQEFNRVLGGVLQNPDVAERFPVFVAHPDVAHRVLGRHLLQARAAANGNKVSPQALNAAFQNAQAEMGFLASQYIPANGAAVPAAPGVAAPPASAPVVAGQVVQPAQVTVAQLLQQAQATQAVAAVAPQNIPAAGGVPGTGVAPVAPVQAGPVNRTDFLQSLKAQTQAGAAQ